MKKRVKKFLRSFRGDHFDNAGAVTPEDYELLIRGIDEVKPSSYIEIGTGRGISTTHVFGYLQQKYPACQFYTLEIFQEHYKAILSKFGNCPNFHALLGLSVTREETTNPAFEELKNYKGPENILRTLLDNEFEGRRVDIAFVDSRKGSALPEFLVLEKRMSSEGIIFCHDILNRGKGVEVLLHLQGHKDRYEYDILDTGPAGMLRIRLKAGTSRQGPSKFDGAKTL